jgi:flagellar hook-basal body complex protein FliE
LITTAIGGGGATHVVHEAFPQSANAAKPSADKGFADILEGLGNALRTGESTAISAIEGKATNQQAVMATLHAEQSLQAALAIRDKIVSAFLEVSRMQI